MTKGHLIEEEREADPAPDPLHQPTLFEWAGGYPALLGLTRIFYGRYVPEEPQLGPLFAKMSPDHPERVAAWLSEVFGGPPLYSQRYGGYQRMVSEHVGKQITPEQRARWASYMLQSAEDAGLPSDAEFRAAFVAYIEWGSRIAMENSAAGAKPAPDEFERDRPQKPRMNRLRPALRRHCRAQTNPSGSTTIFAPCFVQWTATRCCLRSICGRRRTLPRIANKY